MSSTVTAFMSLFDGNREAYGTEDGGCVRCSSAEWRTAIERHLDGDAPIGVYPMWVNMVKWACVDFDEGQEDSWIHARNLSALLGRLKVTAWIEPSRSKGYHVWVFFTSWQKAAPVRRSLKVACHLVGAPRREVNPKAEHLEPGVLGNYVRLPYPKGATDRRIVVDDDHKPLSLDAFLYHGIEQAGLGKLLMLESRHDGIFTAAKTSIQFSDSDSDPDTLGVMTKLSHYCLRALREGPTNGVDRSTWLFTLAHKLWEHNDIHHLTPDEMLVVMRDADERVGKFVDRHDREQRLMEMIERTAP